MLKFIAVVVLAASSVACAGGPVPGAPVAWCGRLASQPLPDPSNLGERCRPTRAACEATGAEGCAPQPYYCFDFGAQATERDCFTGEDGLAACEQAAVYHRPVGEPVPPCVEATF